MQQQQQKQPCTVDIISSLLKNCIARQDLIDTIEEYRTANTGHSFAPFVQSLNDYADKDTALNDVALVLARGLQLSEAEVENEVMRALTGHTNHLMPSDTGTTSIMQWRINEDSLWHLAPTNQQVQVLCQSMINRGFDPSKPVQSRTLNMTPADDDHDVVTYRLLPGCIHQERFLEALNAACFVLFLLCKVDTLGRTQM